ncbi:MAG: formyltetrahydrofolate deformylase [Fibrobacteraceae bacterium]|jgi:formyltetrahydrofolate deformylase|nr:formyltetrahydrofolate deformylase [Fibrobacteraceae bacterium]MBQ5611462.1 formyltetrahydrofolate deformylase [Fibrobacteraceae bacterium]MEE0876055.1 formyltetrahydrofolate deformylase [Fibrobacteraceae bacterium]MEE1276761.1 formyltetrahydrofolate deformylase [Fibrobacteraceae bacterium]
MTRYVLQIHCPDQTGLIAGTTQVLAKAGANIVDLTQHSAKDIGIFFLRAVFEIEENKIEEIKNHLDLLSSHLSLSFKIHDSSKKQRLALFVSKTDHCLYDLLLKQRDGDLDCEFSCIVSNHTVLGPVGGVFGVPFYYVPSNQEKQVQEDRFREIIAETKSDAVILARYMQILSPAFTEEFRYKIINIHHGFLPAFKGAKPYHQAWAKGVKIIGATAHFATEDLDQGPIIAQDVQRIPETASIEQLVQLGKDIEKRTLSSAVKLWLEHRVFVYEGRTFIL